MTIKKFVLYLALVMAIAGCAGASVQNPQVSAPVVPTAPTQIVVYPFATDPSEVDLNSSIIQKTYRNLSGADQSAQQAQIARDSASNICLIVAASLSQKGYSALCQKRGIPVAGDSLMIVDGAFTDISAGNRLRRTIIGLGAGESVVNTDVQVFHRTSLGSHELLDFATHADSGQMPGVLIMGAPGAAVGGAAAIASLGVNVAASGVKLHRSSLDSLETMTAGQIVNEITQYCKEQGWNPSAPSAGTNL